MAQLNATDIHQMIVLKLVFFLTHQGRSEGKK